MTVQFQSFWPSSLTPTDRPLWPKTGHFRLDPWTQHSFFSRLFYNSVWRTALGHRFRSPYRSMRSSGWRILFFENSYVNGCRQCKCHIWIIARLNSKKFQNFHFEKILPNHSLWSLTQYFSAKQPNGVSRIINMLLEKIWRMIRRVKVMLSACAIMNVVIASITVNVINWNQKTF